MQTSDPLDCIIIGSGPAGIACALELHEARKNYVILERGSCLAPQLLKIPNTIRNFPGGFFNSGTDLQKTIAGLVEKLSCKYLLGHEVTEIDLSRRRLVAGGREFQAKTLLIATGCRTRKLNLAREQEFSAHIYETIEGRPSEFKGCSVAVIGGGESALLDALELSQIARNVYLVHRREEYHARPQVIQEVLQNKRIQRVTKSQVKSFEGSGRLTGIALIDDSGKQTRLQIDSLVVKIGYSPNSDLFRGQLDLAPDGHIIINSDGETSCARVFAAGDVTSPPYLRISAAVGQGLMAAASICKLK